MRAVRPSGPVSVMPRPGHDASDSWRRAAIARSSATLEMTSASCKGPSSSSQPPTSWMVRATPVTATTARPDRREIREAADRAMQIARTDLAVRRSQADEPSDPGRRPPRREWRARSPWRRPAAGPRRRDRRRHEPRWRRRPPATATAPSRVASQIPIAMAARRRRARATRVQSPVPKNEHASATPLREEQHEADGSYEVPNVATRTMGGTESAGKGRGAERHDQPAGTGCARLRAQAGFAVIAAGPVGATWTPKANAPAVA